ncbi:MAG: leucine-rich repeat domain-containing protein [Clostridia bacterium]|nr:leucine-rich repeat domain-containing protein [Clostridia bacterium]
MKKKILTSILAASAAIACAATMAGCETLGTPVGNGTENGTQQGASGNVSQSGSTTPAPSHTHTYESGYTFDKYSHWHASSCGHAEEISGKAAHNLDENGCKDCGFKYTQGLEYKLNTYTNEYSVVGVGTATDSVLIIPPKYNGLPVYAVGYNAFNGCTQLTRVIMPDFSSAFCAFGEYAFANCPNLTSVELPSTLKELYRGNFENCVNLKSIELPEALTHIGDDAFVNCGITELYIPKNVYQINPTAFRASNIEKITVDPANPYIRSEGNCIIDNSGNKGEIITALKTAVIPASAQNIGTNAFYECAGLTQIDIPSNITTIKSYGFLYCRDLTEVTLHVGITALQSGAFTGCPSLKDIRFDGTKAQWNAIQKPSNWIKDCGGFTVYCTDGTLTN